MSPSRPLRRLREPQLMPVDCRKLWCTFHSRVEEGVDASLKALGLDYLDLCESARQQAG